MEESKCPFHNRKVPADSTPLNADLSREQVTAQAPAAGITEEVPPSSSIAAESSLNQSALPSGHRYKPEQFKPVGKDLLPEEPKEKEAFSFARLIDDLKTRLERLPNQIMGKSPFSGTLPVERLPVLSFSAKIFQSIKNPITIMEAAFKNGAEVAYLDLPGFAPILFVRDPEIMLQVLKETANEGSFERDRLETQGIGRVVGSENLLYLNDEAWLAHKNAMKGPLGGKVIHSEEIYSQMKEIIGEQLNWLENKVIEANGCATMKLEGSIKTAMLEILSKTMFGIDLPREEYRDKYLPSIERVINYIQLDTVFNPLKVSLFKIPAITPAQKQLQEDYKIFEELVDAAVANRDSDKGLWKHLKNQGSEDAQRSNVKVLLAGALEATTSYITWTLFNLARNPEAQEKVHKEATSQVGLTPESRGKSKYLQQVLSETLRLQAPLYILPRIAETATSVETSRGTLNIPAGTHIILGSYQAGRNERHWGTATTGYPADAFVPERWEPENIKAHNRSAADMKHFGFGYGPRICSGLQFGEAEAFLCLSMFAKRFKIAPVEMQVETVSGIASRPADNLNLEIRLRGDKS